jgi:hypothetical protein
MAIQRHSVKVEVAGASRTSGTFIEDKAVLYVMDASQKGLIMLCMPLRRWQKSVCASKRRSRRWVPLMGLSADTGALAAV